MNCFCLDIATITDVYLFTQKNTVDGQNKYTLEGLTDATAKGSAVENKKTIY